MSSAIQLIGAVLVLAGFVLAQAGRIDFSSKVYLWLNLLGSAALAADALRGHEWGFLLLEGVWAIVSAAALIKAFRRPAAALAAAE